MIEDNSGELAQAEDNAGFGNDFIEPDMPLDLPDMLLWRVMVMPVQMRPVSAGGIAMPGSVLDNAMHLQFIGKVMKLGPLAGRSAKFQDPEWEEARAEVARMGTASSDVNAVKFNAAPRFMWGVKEGDWVVYGRYAGQKVEFRGVRYLIMNDDEILGLANAPDGFRVYV